MQLPCGIFNESYEQSKAVVRTRLQWFLILAVPAAFAFVCYFFFNNYLLSLMNLIGITIIAALGLQILTGYAGQLSIAHAAFMGVGAYTSAILTNKLGLPFWGALPCAMLASGAVGLIFGGPSLRLKGFYLLMATFAAQFLLMYIFRNWTSVTGGTSGILAPAPTIGTVALKTERSYFILIMLCLLIATIVAKNLTRTKIGRAFVAIRDNDLAAEVMGINVGYYKMLAFFISCVFAGLAGSLHAHWRMSTVPDSFGLMASVWYIGYILVGGMGSIAGTFFGVVFIVGLTEGLRWASTPLTAVFPEVAYWLLSAKSIAFGVIIVLFLVFEPRGFAHRWETFKAYYRLWPYPY